MKGSRTDLCLSLEEGLVNDFTAGFKQDDNFCSNTNTNTREGVCVCV